MALTGRSHEGTGIGLSLAHETVKALGGRLDVKSVHGKGSTFSVVLPLGTEHVRFPISRHWMLPHLRPQIPPNLLEPELGIVKDKDRGHARYAARLVEEAGTWLENESVGEPQIAKSLSGSAMSEDTAVSATFHGEKHESPVIVLADDNGDLRQ